MGLHADGTIRIDFGPGLVGWFNRKDVELTWRPPDQQAAAPPPPPQPPGVWLPSQGPKTRLTPNRVGPREENLTRPPRMCRDFLLTRSCKRPRCRYACVHAG